MDLLTYQLHAMPGIGRYLLYPFVDFITCDEIIPSVIVSVSYLFSTVELSLQIQEVSSIINS